MARAIESAPSIFGDLPSTRSERGGQLALIAAAAILAAVSLVVLSNPRGSMALLVIGCAGVLLLGLSLAFSIRHREAVIVAVLMAEVLSPSVFVPDGVSTALRYGIDFLFCAPLLPTLLRSEVVRQGGYRLLAVYFAWALITVTYSLVPVYSLGRSLSSMLLIGALVALAVEVREKADVMKLLRSYLIGCGIIEAIQIAALTVLPHGITYATAEMLDANGNPIPGTVEFFSGGIARFQGILTQPNEVGALTMVTVGVALVYWGGASRRGKYLLAVLIAGALALGIAADSRSALGALAIGVIAFFLWKYRWRGILVTAVAAAIMALAVSLMVKNVGTYLNRGDVASLTGRTDIWEYSLEQIEESPILGYGYEVEGEIYQFRHFPLWWGPWEEGPRSSLHSNYISHLVGVGIPATLLWLFIMLRPWVDLFRRRQDPWSLKPIALLVIVPLLILNFAESGAGDCHYSTGVIFVLCWAIAERRRLLALEEEARERQESRARMAPAFAAIASCAKSGS
jgi:O-antigen ligase